jgi:uracil-DNA glycosylase family 4
MRAKPPSCQSCVLCSHGSDFSAVTGTGVSGLMCIAEASGEHEQREGRPLVEYAPAGSLFERTLRRMGIDREQLSVTNLLQMPAAEQLAGGRTVGVQRAAGVPPQPAARD